MNATLKEWFKGTNIQWIKFFEDPWLFYGEHQWQNVPYGVVLNMKDAEPYLNIAFDSGFGSQQVPNFNAWSEDTVYFVHEYDGSSSLASAERFPYPEDKSI